MLFLDNGDEKLSVEAFSATLDTFKPLLETKMRVLKKCVKDIKLLLEISYSVEIEPLMVEYHERLAEEGRETADPWLNMEKENVTSHLSD